VLERPNRRDWKSRRGAISSWVQIPSSPPTILIPYHPVCSGLPFKVFDLRLLGYCLITTIDAPGRAALRVKCSCRVEYNPDSRLQGANTCPFGVMATRFRLKSG
jgi:hypothetical protein